MAHYAINSHWSAISSTRKQTLTSALGHCAKLLLGTHASSSNNANLLECTTWPLETINAWIRMKAQYIATALPPSHAAHKWVRAVMPPRQDAYDVLPIPLHLPYRPEQALFRNVVFHLDIDVSAASSSTVRRESSLKRLSRMPDPGVEL
eukprot:PhM_4_TR2051/c1_g2_i3/m.9381